MRAVHQHSLRSCLHVPAPFPGPRAGRRGPSLRDPSAPPREDWGLHHVPTPTGKMYHKRSGLKGTPQIYRLPVLKVRTLKSRRRWTASLRETPGDSRISLALLASRGARPRAGDSVLHLTPARSRLGSIAASPFSAVTSPPRTGPARVIEDGLPISRCLSRPPLQSPFHHVR